MAKVTMLAAGKVTTTDSITVELGESTELADVILINWPRQPSVSGSKTFSTVAIAVVRLMAAATIRLAQIRAAKML